MSSSREPLPLADSAPVGAADWPAAAVAGQLLAALGAPPGPVRAGVALGRADGSVVARPADAAQDWAASGAMALTGFADGPALHPAGAPATLARAAALAIELLSLRRGRRVTVDGGALLGERAAVLGRGRAGATSVGGAGRVLRAADAAFALTLSRPSDVELVPALVGHDDTDDPWAAVAAWSATRPVREVADRLALFDLPFGVVPAAGAGATGPAPWSLRRLRPAGPVRARPLVVNLGSLWAAPLCAHLLALAGAEVVDVESPQRPDGARTGTPAFYELLHAGHDRVELDFSAGGGRAELHDLVGGADVVLTGSRIAALERLGLTPGRVAGPRVWARITAHGAGEHRVGFGDDAAVAAGLVAHDGPAMMFAGDAIADPLAGLLGAVAVLAGLESPAAWLIDLSLHSAAASAVRLGATAGDVIAQPPRVAARSVQPSPAGAPSAI